MTNKQKRAIGYAMRERAQKRRAAFIIEHEGNLDGFKNSKYKSMLYYIAHKYGIKIY